MTRIDRRSLVLALAAAPFVPAMAASPAAPDFVFASIDGGELRLADFRGGPVLVVNTASRCMNTPQYDGLQALWERYRDRGLTVVGVPSKSFGQELDTAQAVKQFGEVNFAIDFPMTGLVEVKGRRRTRSTPGRRNRATRRRGTSPSCSRRRGADRRELRHRDRAARAGARRRHRGAAAALTFSRTGRR